MNHIFHHTCDESDEKDVLHLVISELGEIKQEVNKLMSAITDFAEKQQVDIAALNTKLDSIATGVKALDTLITNLQTTVTGLTAEEQAALDAVATASDALVAKADAIDTTVPAAA